MTVLLAFFFFCLLLLMENDEGGYLLLQHQLVRHLLATITLCRHPSTINSRCLFLRTCPTCCLNNNSIEFLFRIRRRIHPTRNCCRRRLLPDLLDVPNPPTLECRVAVTWHRRPNRTAKITTTTRLWRFTPLLPSSWSIKPKKFQSPFSFCLEFIKKNNKFSYFLRT